MSKLFDKTLSLINERLKTDSVSKTAKALGVSTPWLSKIITGEIKNPSVTIIEHCFCVLSQLPLELEPYEEET